MSETVARPRIGAAPIVAIVVGFVVVAALFLGLLGFFFLGVRASPPAASTVLAPTPVAPSAAPVESSSGTTESTQADH